MTTETLDEKGSVVSRSATDTKTALIENDGKRVVLEVETFVEMGGRVFPSQPQAVSQGIHGEPAGQDVVTKDLGQGEVTVEGQKIPCRIQQIEFSAGKAKTVSKVFYSDTVAPYVLRRESVTREEGVETPVSEMTVEAVGLDIPHEVLSSFKRTAVMKTTVKRPGSTVSTLSFVCPEVPGGVVAHQSKETDKAGHLVRTSTLKLTGYGTEPEDRTSAFGRKRPSRTRKPTHP